MSMSASSSTASDNRVAATDQAKVVQGGSVNVETGAGGLTVQGRSNKYIAGQGVDLSGTSIKNGNISVTTADPAVAETALASMSALMQQSSASAASMYNGALSQLSELTQTAQTGGASLASTTIKQIVLIGLAIVGVVIVAVMWRKHKA